ncbi:MAG: glycosyltransferase family 28 protein [Alphaproteobacteria bacterium]|nr:glycosyltransferase family 28 protein [Alphaproteobacteria bacterium]
MIFATVGTQLPFPRLIDALEALAPDLGEEVIAQIGASEGTWPNLDIRRQLTPAEFEKIFTTARVIVAHAGIGTILSAKRWGKPLVILPRRHGLGEHRNDHQLATARQVESLPGIHVAWEAADLGPLLTLPDLTPASDAPSPSHAALIARLRTFIAG